MAPAVKLSIGALLLASVLFAWLGPPPRRSRDARLRGAMLAAGMAGYAAAGAALAAGLLATGALALALAGELVCAVGWMSRGEAPPADEDDEEDGGGGGGGRGPKPPPIDWEAFERALARWTRERERLPT